MTHYLLVFASVLGVECAGLVACMWLYMTAPDERSKKIANLLFSLLALFLAIVWYGLDVNPRTPAIILSLVSGLLAVAPVATMVISRKR